MSDLIAEDRDTVTRRITRGDRTVLLRTPREARAGADVGARLRYGAATAVGLDLPGVARVLGVEEGEGGPRVVLEDFGGRTLRSVLAEGRLEITEAVRIATQLARTLGELHARRVVHKGVEPQSILLNADSGEVKLTNFDAASRLDREEPALAGPPRAEAGPYAAPEQTGRVNRAVDYRADLYALGVTLYEMLTGHVPTGLPGEDGEGGGPVPPERIRPGVPTALSDVVLKLMARNAEDRYQSVEGLVSDLNECLGHLVDGATLADFQIGRNDVTTTFLLPQALYGRTAAHEALLAAFTRAIRGRSELVLVSGPAGVGKTALVHELRAASVRERVSFCAGSGDPVNQAPYGAFRQALGELAAEILAEGAEATEALRLQLQEAVGPGLALVVDAIPALAPLAGSLPQVPRLDPAAARDRFDLAFQEVVGVLARRDRPLALFLDDLHWADDASLRMLEILLRDPGGRHLLIVGAVDDEGRGIPEHVARAVAAVRQGPAAVHEIQLGPLDEADLRRFVADALICPPDDPPRELASFVQRVSRGNPLFVHQLLGWLHKGGILRLDTAAGRWRASVDRLRSSGPSRHDVPAGTVALFDARIGALPAAATRALSIAACFGRRFDLAMTARAAGGARPEVAADLWAAVEAGLLHPIGGPHRCASADPPGDVEYAFVHPHAHAAALARISPELVRDLRRRAGRRLLAEGTDDVYFLADTLAVPHEGVPAPADPDQGEPVETWLVLAELDLSAAQKARACNAITAAERYLNAGIARLPGDAWTSVHGLAYALHRGRAECAHLEGEVTAAEETLDTIRAHAGGDEERLDIDLLHVTLAHGRGDFAGAVRLGCAALAQRGVVLPEGEAAQLALVAETEAVDEALAGARARELLDLPVTTDPAERGRVALLAQTLLGAAQIDPDRFRLAGAMIVRRSLRHGLAPFSSLGYAAYSVVAGALLSRSWPGSGGSRVDLGADLGPFALRLAQRLDGPGVQGAVENFGAVFTSPLRRPLRESLAPLERAHAGLLAAGDLRLGGFAAVQRLLLGLMSGEDLYRLQARAEKYHLLLLRLGRAVSAALSASILRAVTRLTRGPAEPLHLGPPSSPPSTISLHPGGLTDIEGEALPARSSDAWAFAAHSVLALQRTFLFGDHRRALAHAEQARLELSTVRGHPIEAEYCFYHALALAGLDDRASLPVIEAHRDTLAVWAEGSPGGFRHRHLLVAAEAARCVGAAGTALNLYDEAIEASQANQDPCGEAVAAELGARFHLAAGRRHVARAFLLHAREAYARWGADGKVADLRRRHADLLPEAASRAAAASASFDTEALFQASQALSAERSVEGVERLLLTQALTMTGAGRAVLVLDDGETLVEALRSEAGPAFQAPRAASLHEHEDLPRSIVRHVTRTGEGVILEHAAADGPFRSDPYVLHTRTRSVLCVPLRRSAGHEGTAPATGALYLEDNAAAGAFSPAIHAELGTLATQAAISLENAGAHEAIVQKARVQEAELGQTHADLAGALVRVKDAQKRLLVQEKLATLGGLTAGIAHEIKNPLNFINNFAESSVSIADELSEGLGAQRSGIDPEARAMLEELLGELRGNAAKIHEHGRRADDIVRSMLEHSRGGSVTTRAVDVNALLKEYVTLAYQGFRSQDPSFNTSIDQSYAQGLAPLSLVPQDMGRVFLNLVNNACYAVHAKKKAQGRAFSPVLKIATRDLGHAVQIRIRDNGTGIPAVVRERIFQPFFTTKPTGDGTGLGLSISHDIVNERGGTLEVETEEGAFTEFVITLPKLHDGGP